jgi:hypothetical protein
MRRLALLAPVILGALTGCTSTYKTDVVSESTAKLATGSSVLIATPANGTYGGKTYSGSGPATAQAVQSAFHRYTNSVGIVSACSDFDCLLRTSGGSAKYYVVPVILHWEDRATEWSGKRDKIEIKLMVFDGETGLELSSAVIAGKSKWATFGGDHPQDLLVEPISEHVQGLYQ